jgi:nicotinamidase-related amidase
LKINYARRNDLNGDKDGSKYNEWPEKLVQERADHDFLVELEDFQPKSEFHKTAVNFLQETRLEDLLPRSYQ